MNANLVDLPRFVLLADKQRFGPKLLAWNLDSEGEAIYGFSSKVKFDLFRANCDRLLTPYPLVQGYLKNEISEAAHALRLVVIDPAGPTQANLNAATMNCVLQAQEQNLNQVSTTYRLELDRESGAYRVAKAEPDLNPPGLSAEPQTANHA